MADDFKSQAYHNATLAFSLASISVSPRASAAQALIGFRVYLLGPIVPRRQPRLLMKYRAEILAGLESAAQGNIGQA